LDLFYLSLFCQNILDRNHLHFAIEPGSTDWFTLNLGLLASAIVLIIATYAFKHPEKRMLIAKILAVVVAVNCVYSHVYYLQKGTWDIQNNLPFHLCSMSEIIAIGMLLTRSQLLFELLVFWSAGAVHAFITPELTHGQGTYELITYGLSHGVVILAAFYGTLVLKIELPKHAWWKVFLLTQLCIPIIGLINHLSDGNYMFLCQKPNADNPFVIGEWPWYIVGLELAILVHFYAFYLLHRYLFKRFNAQPVV